MISNDLKSQFETYVQETNIEQQANYNKLKNNLLNFGIIYVAIVFFAGLAYWLMPSFDNPKLLLVPILTGLLVFIYPAVSYTNRKKQLTNSYIQQVVYPIFKTLHPAMEYQKEYYVPQSIFAASELFKRTDRYNGEDLFQGQHGDTAFRFSEVHAEERYTTTDSDGNTQVKYRTIFKGIFLVADFNKHLNAKTFVYTSGWKWSFKYKRVKLENPEFEEIFNVYGSDQIEARYVLTPKIMERMVMLHDKFQRNMWFSFNENHMYAALDTPRDYFEIDIAKEASFELVENFLTEVQAVIDVIDELDLNLRIWTKQ